MHLLALKPYKKPELILRLQKDGLLPSDKDSLDSHLQQVRMQSTTGRFELVTSFTEAPLDESFTSACCLF